MEYQEVIASIYHPHINLKESDEREMFNTEVLAHVPKISGGPIFNLFKYIISSVEVKYSFRSTKHYHS